MRPDIGATMRDDFNRLLSRMEQTVPFPGDIEEFYLSLFPRALQVFAFDPETGEGPEARNARTLFRRSLEVTVYCGAGSTVGRAKVKAGMHVSAIRDVYVRLAFPRRVPAPIAHIKSGSMDALGVLVLSGKNPYKNDVLRWANLADALEEKLLVCQQAFEAVEEDLNMQDHWPELLSALGRKPRKRLYDSARRKLDQCVPPEARQEINAILASAVILPDLQRPHAWVGLNPPRSYQLRESL